MPAVVSESAPIVIGLQNERIYVTRAFRLRQLDSFAFGFQSPAQLHQSFLCALHEARQIRLYSRYHLDHNEHFVCVLVQNVVPLDEILAEPEKSLGILPAHDLHELLSQLERHLLRVHYVARVFGQQVPKVDMDQVPVLIQ